MGFDDSDFNKAAAYNSDTQLYKQAGNSIVVSVLEAILTQLLLKPIQRDQIPRQLTLFDMLQIETL
jgi:DNA (cytosine-5)-methyltransferase 1